MAKGKIVELHPTAEEIEHWRDQIRPLYEIRLGEGNVRAIEETMAKAIEKAKTGWPGAPKSFSSRVRSISKSWGTDGENEKNLKQNVNAIEKEQKKIRDTVLARRERELDAFMDLYNGFTKELNPDDEKYFHNRVRYYMREMRFNMSSDLPLLLELIAEELLHRRIMVEVAKGKDLSAVATLSKMLKLITENMSNIQKTLGITRQQRQTALGGTEGSVAEVSMLLDDKRKTITKIETEEKRQEELLMQAKKARGDINPIPDDPSELRRILTRTEAIEVK